jgi:uncharacterized OB-fold protein
VQLPADGRMGALQTKEGQVVQFSKMEPQDFRIGMPVKIVMRGQTITAIDVIAPAAPQAVVPAVPPMSMPPEGTTK